MEAFNKNPSIMMPPKINPMLKLAKITNQIGKVRAWVSGQNLMTIASGLLIANEMAHPINTRVMMLPKIRARNLPIWFMSPAFKTRFVHHKGIRKKGNVMKALLKTDADQAGLLIESFPHPFAHFKKRYVFGFNINAFTRAGVAATAGVAVADRKCPKATQFNPIPPRQSI